MKLVPLKYYCGIHDIDLTDEVKAALEMESPVSFGWAPPSRTKKRESFKVVVRCPGKDGDHPHLLSFAGEVMREDGRTDQYG
jgi:hypothetical protein